MGKYDTDSEKVLLSPSIALNPHKNYLERPDFNSSETQILILIQNFFLKSQVHNCQTGNKTFCGCLQEVRCGLASLVLVEKYPFAL